MINNKPSIYNAQSVYNQGGGDVVGPEIGGIKYPVTKIGNQIWITKNIVVSWPGLQNFDGTITDNDTTPRSVYYNNQPNFFGQYGCFFGRLYNGFAVDYIANPNNGILPDGWRVPTKTDLENLVSFIGGQSEGDKLKSVGYWIESIHNDDFSFSAFPAGYYEKDNGGYKNLSQRTIIYSSTHDSYGKYYLSIESNGDAHAGNGYLYNRNGLRLGASVRVMRDA